MSPILERRANVCNDRNADIRNKRKSELLRWALRTLRLGQKGVVLVETSCFD